MYYYRMQNGFNIVLLYNNKPMDGINSLGITATHVSVINKSKIIKSLGYLTGPPFGSHAGYWALNVTSVCHLCMAYVLPTHTKINNNQ